MLSEFYVLSGYILANLPSFIICFTIPMNSVENKNASERIESSKMPTLTYGIMRRLLVADDLLTTSYV